MSRILMPIPDADFDPTEAAVPWKILTEAGHEVFFATETGAAGAADPLVLRGVLFGQLGAELEPVRFYQEMLLDGRFQEPLRWDEVDALGYDGLFLPGGHAAGMRPFLESERVQGIVRAHWDAARPIAAICHGVLVVARARGEDGRSVLAGRRTTCLPKYMERAAYFLTAWKLGRYYRTYDAYVEEEVREALGADGEFVRGQLNLLGKGTMDDDRAALVVEDGSYLSARWPGDAYLIAKRFSQRLEEREHDAKPRA